MPEPRSVTPEQAREAVRQLGFMSRFVVAPAGETEKAKARNLLANQHQRIALSFIAQAQAAAAAAQPQPAMDEDVEAALERVVRVGCPPYGTPVVQLKHDINTLRAALSQPRPTPDADGCCRSCGHPLTGAEAGITTTRPTPEQIRRGHGALRYLLHVERKPELDAAAEADLLAILPPLPASGEAKEE